MKKIAYFIFVGCILCVNTVYSASFNCKKAGTPTEKAICADAELSGMDEEMAALYKEALGMLDNTGLKADQKAWIKEREKCGGNVQCLKYSYQLRYNSLRSEVDTVYSGVKADGYYDENVEEAETGKEDTPPENQQVSEEDLYINSVKTAYLNDYPAKTIGQGLSPEMFSGIAWSAGKIAGGAWQVIFSGNVTETLRKKAFSDLIFIANNSGYTQDIAHVLQTKPFVPGEKAEFSFTFNTDGSFKITRHYIRSWYNTGLKKYFSDKLLFGILFN